MIPNLQIFLSLVRETSFHVVKCMFYVVKCTFYDVKHTFLDIKQRIPHHADKFLKGNITVERTIAGVLLQCFRQRG